MNSFPDSILQLIDAFSSFPGIGRKTAQRMAFHVLKSSSNIATQLSESVMNMKSKIKFCSICNGITENDPCNICTNPKRDESSICIVEQASDVYTFEKTNSYHGLAERLPTVPVHKSVSHYCSNGQSAPDLCQLQ